MGYPEASLTQYGKVLAFVIDRTRVYVMTGWRKPRLRVGDDNIQVDFYLVREADRGWRLDAYASFFDGRRGPVAAGMREKIVRAVASEVETGSRRFRKALSSLLSAWDSSTTSGRPSETRSPT